MSKQTTRSHYLPQTYLKHFLFDDGLVVYKKGEKFFKEGTTPEQRIFRVPNEAGLKNIGLQNNLYNPGIEGLTSDDLEEIFQEYGEHFYNGLLADIQSIKPNGPIPQDVKDKLCLFMAAMRVRTPQFKSEVDDMGSVFLKHEMAREIKHMTPEEMIKAAKEETGKEISLEMVANVKEMAETGNYKVEYPNAHFIKFALSSLNMHADIFHDMTFVIMKSSKRFFITSDNPVVFFVPPEKVTFYDAPKSLASPHTELFFPLSKEYAVHLSRAKLKEIVMIADREMVDGFNYNISHNSFNFIFSPMEMKKLKEFVEVHTPYPFELKIS